MHLPHQVPQKLITTTFPRYDSASPPLLQGFQGEGADGFRILEAGGENLCLVLLPSFFLGGQVVLEPVEPRASSQTDPSMLSRWDWLQSCPVPGPGVIVFPDSVQVELSCGVQEPLGRGFVPVLAGEIGPQLFDPLLL